MRATQMTFHEIYQQKLKDLQRYLKKFIIFLVYIVFFKICSYIGSQLNLAFVDKMEN